MNPLVKYGDSKCRSSMFWNIMFLIEEAHTMADTTKTTSYLQTHLVPPKKMPHFRVYPLVVKRSN